MPKDQVDWHAACIVYYFAHNKNINSDIKFRWMNRKHEFVLETRMTTPPQLPTLLCEMGLEAEKLEKGKT